MMHGQKDNKLCLVLFIHRFTHVSALWLGSQGVVIRFPRMSRTDL